MTSDEIRQKFLDFFSAKGGKKGHAIIPSASLVPENDSSVLFTTAGMHPLVPYLLGEKHPLGKRLANVQKCVRTDDIDEVGDGIHHTFFEMLGHWSLGDYFKEEAIKLNFEFLTSPEWIGIPVEKINITIFEGDNDAPRDEKAAAVWKNLGIPNEQIFYLPKKENWWGPVGKSGPCGPDTEIFYEFDIPKCGENCNPSCQCGKYSELGNIVFIQYNKKTDGSYEELKQKNIDTGLGLERITAVSGENKKDDYKIDIFQPITKKIEELSGKKYENNIRVFRIIADHIRAAVFILGDERGISPSNIGQGYIVRRLIRRSIRQGKILSINKNFTSEVAKACIGTLKNIYKEIEKNKDFIFKELEKEENNFRKTLEKGMRKFEKNSDSDISGENAFILFSTYGFPIEMTQELAEEKGIKVDTEGFKKEMVKHQELSRTASAGMFKGGLADSGEETKKLHTATHLLLAALRKVLGGHVVQKGSNITAERLRLDFSYPEKLTDEQKTKVEKLVNEKIKENLPVICEEMSPKEAEKSGALGEFGHKYGEKVKVYSINNFSREICGGPHVEKTGELGEFKIKKEEASSARVRRIKAIIL
ncbi:MAG: alanine--tRNA ligase [Candidatus Tagabacteria bacterium CG09_land_8_20_14_0_10_41_14]|uniref:Alanine--tRNA ligase n=2 Tax=Candidatus Tagaibacteriota TaxID=1817918 RepID=A0A2H0WN42_9BACT|nr:MAG: alanine--tRNA ligase [Candidatus Tagabacteria bacterium CG09_land_8_20_14_0_10_41_14]PJE72936.1 MAG: alanine--tRNA ligase [Candidatus Tagabacteria bacterium CG10_big_fil_rev_8_21_14_0_10_40_13]